MAAKKKPKEYSQAEGAALLRKQWAESKGKPKNLRKVAEWAGTVAINAIPTGRAASVVAKTVARGKATKLASGEAVTKVRKFTQGKNATIKNTPPKKSGVGPNSPIKGTKVEVAYKTKKISPKQAAWQQSGISTISKTKQGLTAVKSGSAGAYVSGNSAANASKKKSDKKKK
jgi:hypothetical protein